MSNNADSQQEINVMTKKYAAIELNSGFVWGVTSAETPEAACAAIQSEATGFREAFTFESISKSDANTTAGGFALYEVAENFDVQDGQAIDEIEKTKAYPLTGYFREVPMAE